VAIVAFILAGLIAWPQALVMMAGAAIGGYAGARWARKSNPKVIRGIVLTVGGAMTAYFFVRNR
jgi:uncharacterized membrane protein YfcA